jgi:CBS domain-containing protein/sporulation protein YlmC with PRC-barrel domain
MPTTAAERPVSRTRPTSLYLAQVLGKPVLDATGAQIARVKDVVVRFGVSPRPPISGIVARGGRRDFFLDRRQIASIGSEGVRLATFKVDLRPFARRDGEVLLRRDILDKQLIDVDGRRVVRANDLQLAQVDGQYRLAGVDVSLQALWRRLGPERLTANVVGRQVIDWADIESFATDVPMVRLRASHAGVSRLHPVEIAQIVDALSPRQGQEILEALDDETAADTVQELDPDDAADLLERLDPERAADILDEMEPDDAADVLAEMPAGSSEELLGLMGPDESEDVRELLTYAEDFAEDAAAGLMTTDIVTLARDLTAGEGLALLRAREDPPAPLYHLYLVEPDAVESERPRLVGVVPLRDLVLADPATPLAALAAGAGEFRSVRPDEPARDVARLMAEYNLASVPVVDAGGSVLGVIHVDDAMDVLLPDLWGRRLSGRLFH